MVEIIPSILVGTKEEFIINARAVAEAVSMVQIDIADGKFVESKTWADPDVIEDVLEVDCELHMMVEDPVVEARYWEEVPQVKRILFHAEAVADVAETVSLLHAYEWEIGVVLNPGTPIDVLDPVLEEIDVVMFMGVEPGSQGQRFIPTVLKKIEAFAAKETGIPIAIDGGVNEDTLEEILRAGATRVCPGSAIFGEGNPAENVAKMKRDIHTLTKRT